MSGGAREPIVVFGTGRMATLVAVVWTADFPQLATLQDTAAGYGFGSPQAIGETFLGQYVLAFEVTSVLLLAAIIGAVALARRRDTADAR